MGRHKRGSKVTVEPIPLDKIAIGDIVLCKVKGKQYLHIVKAKDKGRFLIGNNQLLNEGEPAMYLYLHSKYISEINNNNLCSVIKKAKDNGDLGFYSEYNKASLMIKYAGMLKHRGCFGI